MTGALSIRLATSTSIALVVVGLVLHRIEQRGVAEMIESDRAFDAGQLELAVQHARSAAMADLPGAEHVRRGYERLRAVARGAEAEHDLALASWAWHAMRMAALDARHLWQPHASELHEADAELARLSPGTRTLAVSGPEAPGAARALALAGGAACALAGLWGLSSQESFDAWDGSRRRLRLSALSALVGVASWVWALLAR